MVNRAWAIKPAGWFMALACLCAVELTIDQSLAQERPPNVIFVLADDLGWGDLGCYGHHCRIDDI